MPLKAFEDFAPEPLAFPIGGKVYTVPEVGYQAGMRLQAIEAGEDTDTKAEDQWRLLMGDAYDAMIADNVPITAMNRAVLTCLTDYRTGNRELAEQVWEAGISPEALAPVGATEETASTSTGEASSTPTQDFTSGTTSPKASKPKAKAARSQKSAASGP